jgi:hypothetical protein
MTRYGKSQTKAAIAAAYRKRRRADGWQFWQVAAPPGVVIALAALALPGEAPADTVRRVVLKTGSPGQ